MRERARDKGRLEDIIEYSTNVTSLIEGYSLEALIADKRTYYSVMKNVEVVGEAAYMLTKAFKKSHPEIPWKVFKACDTCWFTTMRISFLKRYMIPPSTTCCPSANR